MVNSGPSQQLQGCKMRMKPIAMPGYTNTDDTQPAQYLCTKQKKICVNSATGHAWKAAFRIILDAQLSRKLPVTTAAKRT